MRKGGQDKEGLNPVLSFLILGFFLIFLFKLVDWGFLKSEITAYPVKCREKVILGQCKDPEYTLRYTRYKVMSGRQEVLDWVEGFDVKRLTKCAVRDRKNWTCRYDDESAEFGFTNGRYWSVTNPEMATPTALELDEKIAYVSRLKWLSLQCRDPSEPYWLCLPLVILLD